MTTEQREIFAAIIRERRYQNLKYPNSSHTVGEWLLILQRELQEAITAWVKKDGDGLEEILQVAAVAVACMEEHGLKERSVTETIFHGLKTGQLDFAAGFGADGRLTEITVLPRQDIVDMT